MSDKVTIAALQQMKRDGKKSVGVVAWDYQLARIADRAGFDFVSVGDSVGVNLWGRSEVARGDARRDADLLPGGAARRRARTGQLRHAVWPGAAGHRRGAAPLHFGSSRTAAPT